MEAGKRGRISAEQRMETGGAPGKEPFVPTRRQALQLMGSTVAAAWAGVIRLPSTSWPALAGDSWARVLASYVGHTGWIDYTGLKHNPVDLYRFLHAVAQLSPRNDPADFPSPQDQIAYWINAYNALVVGRVVQNLPLQRITDIGLIPRISFYDMPDFQAGGQDYSLEDIEHGILLGNYGDVRVIFALAIGARFGPHLGREPYAGPHLNAQLDAAAICFLTDPNNLDYNVDTRVLRLSPILLWHAYELRAAVRRTGVLHPTLVDYLRWYVPADDLPAPNAEFALHFEAPDWRLNGS